MSLYVSVDYLWNNLSCIIPLEEKVADADHIENEGRLYKLSSFVGTFMPEERRNASGAYQGAKYFSYNGELLSSLRSRCEHEE